MFHKKMQSKANPNNVKNLKKIVSKMESLATAGDIDKLKAELLEQKNKMKFASLPPKMKLRILRVLDKKEK